MLDATVALCDRLSVRTDFVVVVVDPRPPTTNTTGTNMQPSWQLIEAYKRFAVSGAALIISGNVMVNGWSLEAPRKRRHRR